MTDPTEGPRFPSDLAAWHRWSARQHRLRAIKSSLTPPPPRPRVTTYRNSQRPPDLIVSVASASPSARAALFAPLDHSGHASIAVISDADVSGLLTGWEATERPWRPLLSSARAVLGDGHYMSLGHEIWSAARDHGLPYFVSQHGALTALMAPLPPDANLLAWSDEDAAFWTTGRADVRTTTVGSQLLWSASHTQRAAAPARPAGSGITYAGQLHGAELARWGMTRAAFRFCKTHGARYRPHPNERDRLSRAAHLAFVRAGIQVDADSRPLAAETGALVSVFSTGVLEAAACGRPAWVDYPDPPPWLSSFWRRYAMSRWGGDPTPPPALPPEEPAATIMRIVLDSA